MINDYSDIVAGENEVWGENGWTRSSGYGGAEDTSSLYAVGTNSIASSGTTQSSVFIEYNSILSGGAFAESGTGVVSIWEDDILVPDTYQWSAAGSGFSTIGETGWYAQSGGESEGSYSYVSQNELITDAAGSDEYNGSWSSDTGSSWGTDGLTEVGSKALTGTWTGETWGSFTTSSATEGTVPGEAVFNLDYQPTLVDEDFIENDDNTFLASIDGQLASVGGFVSAGFLTESYNPSPWEFAYLGGTTIADGATEGSPYTFQAYIGNSYGTSTPDTDSATPNGLPGKEVARFAYFGENYSVPDGVSRSAAPDPSATLVGLAASSRNPTDITIPVLAGSEGSSGEGGDAIIAGGSGSTTAGAAGEGLRLDIGELRLRLGRHRRSVFRGGLGQLGLIDVKRGQPSRWDRRADGGGRRRPGE